MWVACGEHELKVLFAIRNSRHHPYHRTTIEALRQRGHTVVLGYDPLWDSGDELPEGSMWLAELNDRRQRIRIARRELRSYAAYLRRSDTTPFYVNRWRRYLPRPLRALAHLGLGRRLIASSIVERLLARAESRSEAAAAALADLEAIKPDVIVASPCNMRWSNEIEYVRAAARLDIPSVIPVLSWDNLTTKGLLHVTPTRLLAWNERQAEEAVRLHAIPPEAISVTGSPFFDKWFEASRQPSPRDEFCDRAGLDPERPIVLYLGSSENIDPDETPCVERLLAALKASGGPLRSAQILVRAHPANGKVHERLESRDIRVWPRRHGLFETDEILQNFLDSLHHAVGAVGINTSGMLDAVLNDVATFAIVNVENAQKQMLTPHFRYLVDGEVVTLCADEVEAVEGLESLLEGRDETGTARQEFARWFARPRGIERAAGEVAADAIEEAFAGYRDTVG